VTEGATVVNVVSTLDGRPASLRSASGVARGRAAGAGAARTTATASAGCDVELSKNVDANIPIKVTDMKQM
jgi:hypothetical protein